MAETLMFDYHRQHGIGKSFSRIKTYCEFSAPPYYSRTAANNMCYLMKIFFFAQKSELLGFSIPMDHA